MNPTPQFDDRLRRALDAGHLDTAALDASVRRRIRAQSIRRMWLAAAALVVIGFGAGIVMWKTPPLPRLYADALRDHRAEVVEHQPRRWRSTSPELDSVTARFGLSQSQARSLAPAGYRLQHAKVCGLAGAPVLHLVYSNGTREVSVFVRQNSGGGGWNLSPAAFGAQYLDPVRTARYSALILAEGTRTECAPFERSANAVL